MSLTNAKVLDLCSLEVYIHDTLIAFDSANTYDRTESLVHISGLCLDEKSVCGSKNKVAWLNYQNTYAGNESLAQVASTLDIATVALITGNKKVSRSCIE